MQKEDIPRVVELGRLMHSESAYSDLSFNTDKCFAFAQLLIDNTDALIIVAVEDNEIAGMFAAFITSPYFSNELIAEDIVFYVSPKHRQTSASIRLLSAYLHWAEQKQAKTITAGISCEVNTDEIEKLFIRYGFRRAGLIMRKNNG